MPNIEIWTSKQIDNYDHPPKFNSIERKKYFSLPNKLQKRVDRFSIVLNQIGFCLMYGYFKSNGRFYPPEYFHQKDIDYISGQFGLLFFGSELNNYNRQTYNVHRKIILAHFGYTAFQIKQHSSLIYQIIEQPLSNFQQPNLLLAQTLEGLAQRRIELPSYYTLQTILTSIIRKQNRKLHQQLELHLEPKHREALNVLLLKKASQQYIPDKEQSLVESSESLIYWLTYLKKLIRKDNPKSIRINIQKHQVLFEVFDKIESLLTQLKLNDNAIRYFGELAIKYKSNQTIRRKGAVKYLLLLGFVAYQARSYEDHLVDIYLSACQTALNTAQNKYKNHLFESRLQRQEQMKKALLLAKSKQDLLHEIRTIVHQPSTVLSAEKKSKPNPNLTSFT